MTTDSDGSYGRLDGDLTLSLGAGADIPMNDEATRAGARLSLHYFWMAGVYGTYTRTAVTARVAQVVGFGIDMRPAFLPRFIQNMEHGPATWDLMLDSISLGVGAFFADAAEPSHPWDRGLETSLGFSIPLLGTATGWWLDGRALARWPEREDASSALWIGVSYQHVFLTPLTKQAAEQDIRF